jgi:H+/Cl- antiporter ClcA
MSPLASIVDWDALLQVIWVGAAAGVGVPALFAVALFGVTRAADLGRDGRRAEAALYGALGLAALAVVTAAVVYGIVVMTRK